MVKVRDRIGNREINKNGKSIVTLDKLDEDKDYDFVKRIYNYKYDLKDILLFWKNKIQELSEAKVNKKNTEKVLNKNNISEEDVNVKQVNKKEVRVKYDYKNPDGNIKTLIPLCNDILIIGKADS